MNLNCILCKKERVHDELFKYTNSSACKSIRFNKRCRSYQKGQKKYPGIHKTLKKKFFPTYKRTKRKRTTLKKASSKKIGSRVDKEIGHYIVNKSTNKMHTLTKVLIEYFNKNQHILQASQVPVYIPSLQCITQADIITCRKNPITCQNELWLWELKTGYSPGLHTKRKGRGGKVLKLKPPFHMVDNVLFNHFFLQLYYTHQGFKEYANLPIKHANVIQVYQEGVKKKKKFKVAVHSLSNWLKKSKINLY